ncbi:MAG TPA: carbamoyltransferase C-terminal domain-containing protein [Usitatibacter sp.]|nr:carbamoyltransferase C-terminal domain-containing protein [Usitatibacter sp.]
MTWLIGLNAFHGDSAACIVRDGELIAAAEEERFRRVKHWAGFPSAAIRYCLAEAGITAAQIDIVAINQDASANIGRKLAYAVVRRPELSIVLDRIRNKRERAGILELLKAEFPEEHVKAELCLVEHHLAHLASTYLASPFADAVVVSVDGFGDFASAAWGVGRDGVLELEDKVYFPHSLGIFYQAMTQYLGFPKYGDEYKVMGLAPYGEPSFTAEMESVVRLQDDGTFRLGLDCFRHHKEKVEYEWENGEPSVGKLYSASLEDLLGPARDPSDELSQRHKDIARSVQATYERAFFHLLNRLHDRYGLDAVALAGGCAMNSVANGKVLRETPFRQIYVQAAAGDAGGAIGAALKAWADSTADDEVARRKLRRFDMQHAYWGPSYSDEEIETLLRTRRHDLGDAGCTIRVLEEAELVRRSAQAIADGKVVGWFQGRMEWGPRALGNRSILADARRADMKDVLNSKIKRRESFRPFAPSMLRERMSEWFACDDDVPFMMQVYPIRPEMRARIPAVTHVDGSGRVQTVTRASNPRYYALIEAFDAITGVPMVLNTSFNENEPVVCHPREALDCFLRTRMDVLVMGDTFIERAG